MHELSIQFKEMSLAQRTYVLSILAGRIFQDPESYGLKSDGILRIGDKLNLSKLFEKPANIRLVFERAQNIVVRGSAQEKIILANNEKIKEWIKNNPDVKITADKVAEILSEKPKTEITAKPEEIPKPNIAQTMTDAEKAQIFQEVESAKNRIIPPENQRNPNLERSLASDAKAFISDSRFGQDIEEAFRSEIDSIYGRNGFLGVGKTAGIDAEEWKEMAKLPAGKVVEYYTGNSAKSGLPNDVMEALSKSKGHNMLMKQMAELMKQSNWAVKPFENENMEQFIKRLGGYILRTYMQKTAQSAK